MVNFMILQLFSETNPGAPLPEEDHQLLTKATEATTQQSMWTDKTKHIADQADRPNGQIIKAIDKQLNNQNWQHWLNRTHQTLCSLVERKKNLSGLKNFYKFS